MTKRHVQMIEPSVSYPTDDDSVSNEATIASQGHPFPALIRYTYVSLADNDSLHTIS